MGICAMEKKTMSKPMKEILSRLNEFEYIETTIFPEDIIVNVSKNYTNIFSIQFQKRTNELKK